MKMATHLKDLTSDSQLYGWKHARAFHGVWLNQLKQGKCTWFDKEVKLQFCTSLIWHPVHTSLSYFKDSRTSPRTRQCRSQACYSGPVKPDTKACKVFNEGMCDKQMTHASL